MTRYSAAEISAAVAGRSVLLGEEEEEDTAVLINEVLAVASV